MNLQDLSTPCLVLDQGRLETNIEAMRSRLRGMGVALRPHGKTSKSIEVMNLALAGQERKITVSTLKEAEYFLGHGITDLTYAVGIAPRKLDRAARLIQQGAELTLILDTLAQAQALSARGRSLHVTFKALIEIDCDGHRAGVAPDDPALVEIGTYLHTRPGVALSGILTHAGESYHCPDRDAIIHLAEQERRAAVQCSETLLCSGLPCQTVSIGSTPTMTLAANLSGVTEARPGVYMFNDLMLAGLEVCTVEQIALSTLAAVIGHQQRKGWILIDAGFTALSHDRGTAGQRLDQGYGLVCDVTGRPLADLIVKEVNQEHGIIASRTGKAICLEDLPVDSLVRILPNHACATAAMHPNYHVVRGSTEITGIWERINGW